MGRYTQLHLGVQLRRDVPEDVVSTLRTMLSEETAPPASLPNDPLFATYRWRHMLTCDSYYFNYKTTHLLQFDDITQQWWFNVTCNLKNYDREIEQFLSWLAPYIDAFDGDWLGYMRYEETEEPTTLFMGTPPCRPASAGDGQ